METLHKTNKSFLNVFKSNNDVLLKTCVEEVESLLISNPEIKIFGKVCKQNRSVGFFSDESRGYKYSGQIMASQKLTPTLTELLQKTNELFKANYNGILVNKYSEGKDYIGAHSDDESALDAIGVVAISYGEERNFRIRDKNTKKIVIDVPTQQGMYIHMGGKFQQEFTHEIPKQLRLKGTRYSFTFRKHIE